MNFIKVTISLRTMQLTVRAITPFIRLDGSCTRGQFQKSSDSLSSCVGEEELNELG